MAIDEKASRVRLERWGEVKGQSARLIISLAEPFRQAMKEERAPENYPFTKTQNLKGEINCTDDETLRQLVHRTRNKLSKLATLAGDPPPSIDAVIESSQWHGYRLNPNQVRIVALSDLQVPP